jgi:hypothetical protein
LVTGFAFCERALTQGEHGTQHFPADRPALLAEGYAPFSKRVSLRGYPETFSHCRNEIKQLPCGNETRGDHKEQVCSA